MKYTCTCLLAVGILTAGCSKSKTPDTPPPPPQIITVGVLEKQTDKPIKGVAMTLLRCGRTAPGFGCINYDDVQTLFTNDSGKVSYSSALKIEAIDVRHPNYYPARSSFHTITLTPVATIEARIRKVNQYMPNEILIMRADFECKDYCDSHILGLPADTTVFFNGYGYSSNQLIWYIFDTTGIGHVDSLFQTPFFHINGFDTAEVVVEY